MKSHKLYKTKKRSTGREASSTIPTNTHPCTQSYTNKNLVHREIFFDIKNGQHSLSLSCSHSHYTIIKQKQKKGQHIKRKTERRFWQTFCHTIIKENFYSVLFNSFRNIKSFGIKLNKQQQPKKKKTNNKIN